MSALVAVACVLAFGLGLEARRVDTVQHLLASERARGARDVCALKFFELQTTLGVADYGHASQGIAAWAPAVRALARRLPSIDDSFRFVSDRIGYTHTSDTGAMRADVVLKHRIGNCQGKANLLFSLLMAQGVSPSTMRIVYAELVKDGMPSTHAWVELHTRDRWWVIDSTPFLAVGPGVYDRDRYYAQNSVVPVLAYTDTSVDFTVK